MINVKIKEEVSEMKVNINDVFEIDKDWFILINTPFGYCISSIECGQYIQSEKQLTSLEEVKQLLSKVEKEHKIVHYPTTHYKMELNVEYK